MDIGDFEKAVASSETPEALWEACRGFIASRGVSRIAYVHFPPVGAPDADLFRMKTDGFAPEDVEHYVREKLYRSNPRIGLAQKRMEPFYWDEVPAVTQLQSERDRLYAELDDRIGAPFGYGIPVFGPNGRNGFVGLTLEAPRLSEDVERDFRWAFQIAHLRYCAMLADAFGPVPALSEREREVLAWVARGKSNPAIGTILGISAHTVDAHLRRIYLKLGVYDRITATVRGLGVGLIQSDV